jgi:protein-tyrosine phosphatase
MVKVLFVCLGNICRSPMAEGIFIHKIQAAGLAAQFEVDSCGTGDWHAGERADIRARRVAGERGVELPSRARVLRVSDFYDFDYILAMDGANLLSLQNMQPAGSTARLYKMRHFDPQAPDADVPDPYYGEYRGFEEVFDMLDRSCDGLLAFIQSQEKARK